jgi:hypothetical protein
MSKMQVSSSLTTLWALPCLCMIANRRGSYVNCLGIRDRGTPDLCPLSDCFFVEPYSSNLLKDTAHFRGLGIGTFLLSCLQVLGSLGYKSPFVAKTDVFCLACHKKGQDLHMTHHLYLQLCLEMGSPYVSYVQLGFTNVLFENGLFGCSNYPNECPVLTDKPSKSIEEGYVTDDTSFCLLVLKKWLLNVYPMGSPKLTTILLQYATFQEEKTSSWLSSW